MDLNRFFTAFNKLGKLEGSTEATMFTTTMSLRYRFDTEALADDADDLRAWASGILDLARTAHVAGEFDLPSFLVAESLATEFETALAAVIDEAEMLDDLLDDDADIDLDLDDDVFDDGFFAELDIDLDDEEAEQLSDEFYAIIDANYLDEDDDCTCAVCTAAIDAAELDDAASSVEDLSPAVETLTAVAYRAASEHANHPSMRDAVNRYVAEWHAAYDTARKAGPYELAEFVVRLTELVDDTMFMLLAKGSPVDAFADTSIVVLNGVKRQLALV